MNKDEYGEIINGCETFIEIANQLKKGKSVIIGWTDEVATHYDILFTGGAYKEYGNILQRGIRETDLYVSIMGHGAFGFDTKTLKENGYVAEKLCLLMNETSIKITELLNGIIAELN